MISAERNSCKEFFTIAVPVHRADDLRFDLGCSFLLFETDLIGGMGDVLHARCHVLTRQNHVDALTTTIHRHGGASPRRRSNQRTKTHSLAFCWVIMANRQRSFFDQDSKVCMASLLGGILRHLIDLFDRLDLFGVETGRPIKRIEQASHLQDPPLRCLPLQLPRNQGQSSNPINTCRKMTRLM